MVIVSVNMTMTYDSVSITDLHLAHIAKALLFGFNDTSHPSCTASIADNKRAYHCCNIGYCILFYHFVLLILVYVTVKCLYFFLERKVIAKKKLSDIYILI